MKQATVAVAGPPLSGVTSLVSVLACRLPGHRVVDAGMLGRDEGVSLVVFVVSAAAPLTGSDAALLDAAARRTDGVVAAISKVDVHRTWSDTLRVNQAALAAHAPRYRGIRWAAVAGAPEVGVPAVDELVAAVEAELSKADLVGRNALRARCSELAVRVADYEREDRRRRARIIELRDQQRVRAQLRGQLGQARVQLTGQARAACVTLRGEFHERSASTRRVEAFRVDVHRRAAELCDELDGAVTCRLVDLGARVRAPENAAAVDLPPIRPPGPENRLSVLAGLGFGLGSAVTLDRLVGEWAPGWGSAVGPGCLAAGAMIGLWVVAMRRTIAMRAALDRWVSEVSVALRASFEERIATRMLAAETALCAGGTPPGAADGVGSGGPPEALIRELARVRRQLGESG